MLVNTGVACKGRDCGGVPAGQTTDEILHREDCQPSRHRELRKAENLWPTLTVGPKVNSCTPLDDRSLILDQSKRGTSLLGILISNNSQFPVIYWRFNSINTFNA